MKHSAESATKPQFTNRLIHETSPYLRQHAHNPVDWHAWGPEALEMAQEADKPILLSIGYSACHWCHVMERESFENEEIARIMNDHFINVKVDREERPDLDTIYMNYVQMSTGSGGWPMTVFLTPHQIPFFGGTYFPPDDRYGRPGFPRLCMAVAEAYQTRRKEIEDSGPGLIKTLQEMNRIPVPSAAPEAGLLAEAYSNLAQRFDLIHGGFAGAPKFPGSMSLSFCLRHYLRSGQKSALDFVELSLEKMANGGMYDQLGGGFHRYSVDDHWLVPHFEKMLYDNALLSRLYLEACQLTGKPFYKRVVEEILDYVLREMTHPEGGFYSTQDADSEGEEGKFFVWTPEEIQTILETKDAELFCHYYDVTRAGNFERSNILNVPRSLQAVANEAGIDPNELSSILEKGRHRLFEQREKRIKPHRDEKILTSWNGLMLVSFANASRVCKRDDYLRAAKRNAQFVLRHLSREGKLLRTCKDGQSKFNAYLEDYANFVEGLLALYEASGEICWLQHAVTFNEVLLNQFWDEESSSFYLTGRDHENLITRVKDFSDNATPAGSSVAVFNLLKLAIHTGRTDYRQKAEANLKCMHSMLERYPGGFGYLIEAADFFIGPVREIVIMGQKDDPSAQSMLETVYQQYLPNKVVAFSDPAESKKEMKLPLLEGKGLVNGKATAYVCQSYVCMAPVISPMELEKVLKGE